MSDLRQAAQQALRVACMCTPEQQIAKEALRAALAQPEPRNQCGETCERAKLCAVCARGLEGQDPVVFTVTKSGALLEWEPTVGAFALPDGKHSLYTHPPRREWQGLSEEDMEDLLPLYSDPSANTEMLEFAAAIEVKLKERNNG